MKYWAKKYGITGVTRCLTSYALILLVIFYLQQLNPPVLPPILTLQELAEQKEFNHGWLSSFCDEHWTVRSSCLKEENNLTLKELLAGFFQYYRDFDYQNVICPSVGRPIPTDNFRSVDDIPEEMQLYKEKLQREPNNLTLKFNPKVMIRTQDPLELHWNITKNVADKIFFVFIAACEESCKLMADTDERSLLRRLFSIDRDSLYLTDQTYVRVNIGLASVAPSGLDIDEQYKLTMEAVLLVMRQVMKAEMELYEPKVLSKVQKVNPSQDVHTTVNAQTEDEGLVYNCHGNGNVIALRKKIKTKLEKLHLLLSEYEQEVCISNALQSLTTDNNFSFELKMSSLKKSTNSKSLVIILSGKEEKKNKKAKKAHKDSFSKEVANFIMHNLKKLVKCAVNFIIDTKSNSPAFHVKQSLRELIDLKMAKLPNPNDILRSNSLEGDSPSTSGCDTNILHQQCLLLQSIEKDNNKQGSAKTQAVIDEFLTPYKPDRLVTLDCVKGDTIDKFSDMLNTVLSCETQSSLTIEKNPFIASIEKVQLHELTLDKNKSESSITKTDGNCKYVTTESKEDSYGLEKHSDRNCKYMKKEIEEGSHNLEKQYKAQLRNVNNKNNESIKRKMDLNYDIAQTNSDVRS